MIPKNLNFKMPAEWENHSCTFISWPVLASMCYPENYNEVCQGYKDIIHAISEFENVKVLVNKQDIKYAKRLLSIENIDYLEIEHSDAWIRDNGPTFITNSNNEIAAVNWQFNSWGGKYPPWEQDNNVAPIILSQLNIKQFDAPLVMEGGSIHSNGNKTLLTTQECLLNKNRNPDLSLNQIENHLTNYLNVEKIIWLNKGLDGDETDGHVDNIACFGSENEIIIQVCDDKNDKNYSICEENLQIIENTKTLNNSNFNIIKIPQPSYKEFNNKRLTLSYLNFYFVNNGIILPIFNDPNDNIAISILKNLYPNRKIKTINGLSIIKEGGNVHCTTQQMPGGML